jgi:AAA ATPase domain
MTTYVYIDNFRGFSEALIPLRQVNFLVGENSTGKTSFLELIETFSNMSFWLFEPRYGTPGGVQRHFLDLVSASAKSKKAFSIGAVEFDEVDNDKSFGMLVTYKSLDGRPVPSRVSVIHGTTVKTLDGKLWRSNLTDKYKSRTKTCLRADTAPNCEDKLGALVAIHKSSYGLTDLEVTEERAPGPLFLRFDDILFDGKGIDEREFQAPFPFRSNFVELAPIRTKPRRTYDAPQTEFSPEGEHTPYVIRKRLTSKTQAEAFQKFLENAGKSSGLFKSISLRQYGHSPLAPFEMKVVLGKSALGLENVGYGVSQALPVLVEMFVRPRKTAFTIQQPEVHLHPKAQATFGDLIAELARGDSKTFVVETHSDFTIDRFRLNVRTSGPLPSQLLFFERTDIGNRATHIPISDNGDLDANQPDAYRAFFYNESLALLS